MTPDRALPRTSNLPLIVWSEGDAQRSEWVLTSSPQSCLRPDGEAICLLLLTR